MKAQHAHKVADVRFSTGHVSCTCGWSSDEPDDYPDTLNERYQGHRVAVGLPRKNLGHNSGQGSPWEKQEGWAA